MKIKRFYASDMRQALREVRESMGPDAVILSNKNVEGGVELVAAMDYDETAFSKPAPQSTAPRRETAANSEPRIKQTATQPRPRTSRQTKANSPQSSILKPTAQAQPSTRVAQKPTRIEWSQDPILREMRQEMHALRRLMENELSELTWRDLGQRRPQSQQLIRRLLGLGLTARLCRELAYRAEDAPSLEKAWQQALLHLVRKLPILRDDLVDRGGVIALVGPSGVGKTTTIAKLAARFCLRHGNRQLALITTDSYRIGAQEQLQNYGRILDVPVRSAATTADLNAVLHMLAEKRLILIDTAGMGQRDLHLTERLSMLTAGNHPVQTLLTLAATTQHSAIIHAIRAFSVIKPMGVVLTKVDEAASLGDILSPLIEAKLALTFVTDGQRVPEDLHMARAHFLVKQTLELAKAVEEPPAEEYLAYAYGGTGDHARF